MQEIFRQLESGAWADMDITLCPCRGGWLLSDFDTFHCCPFHGKGVPHPEDDETSFDYNAHLLGHLRKAYRVYRSRTGLSNRAFRLRVCAHMFQGSSDQIARARAAVEAARMISEEICSAREEARAHRRGFTCALEVRLHNEAMWERKESGLCN